MYCDCCLTLEISLSHLDHEDFWSCRIEAQSIYNVLPLACHTNGLYQRLLACKNNHPANTFLQIPPAGLETFSSMCLANPPLLSCVQSLPCAICPALCISIIIESRMMLCVMLMYENSATKLSDAPYSHCKQKRRSSCIAFLQTSPIFPLSGSTVVSPLFKNPLCWCCLWCLKLLLSLTKGFLLLLFPPLNGRIRASNF